MSWNNDGGAAENYNGGDAEGGGGGEGGGFSGECFNCGQTGHSKQSCPEPPKPRPCFNCGEEGHSKAECTNERVQREFTGTCRICEEVGHRAVDCPSGEPRTCNNCKEEGHTTMECKNPRKIDYSGVDDVAAEEAWAQITAAAEDNDLDDVKAAALRYFKACPETTYVDMEKGFRSQDIKVYLIAIEKELLVTYTNMDLQGNLGKKYTVNFRFSDVPHRPREKELWPSTPEENLERLADAGVPVDVGVPKCSNCNELGHTWKNCDQDKTDNADRAVLRCYNCEEEGHRVRDCPKPRPDKWACRNCGKSGHGSKECPEPRNPANVTCKVCDEKGHFAKDCPQGGGGGGGGACHNCGEEGHRKQDCTNERVLICRNCDGVGHISRECPKPRDYSRVKCSNCSQMGHTKVRCKEPIVEDADAGQANGYGGGGGGGETSGEAAYGGGESFEPAQDGGNGESAW
ncbi:Cellular nucleic acid-binding protein-like [Lachnellula arida]|uniref:Cellular nucleic acid-binding protein-like n=1 Tax=Lachnellula arida TaxID=1316785 RepID=A0A8T9BHW7_9HELO|nr:Cellular nucleic acid-binding protein-like [Lachnellula arida]